MSNELTVNCVHIATFVSFQEWVRYASDWLKHNKRKCVLLCLDSMGNACFIGEDFMAARDHNLFPVNAYLITRAIEGVNEIPASLALTENKIDKQKKKSI